MISGIEPDIAHAFVPDSTPDEGSSPIQTNNPAVTTALAENYPDLLDRVVNYDSDKLAAQRELFLAAEKALHKHQFSKFSEILPTLNEYPLYPYLRYQDLSLRVNKATSKELTEFFTNYETQPISWMLRKKVLNHSARRGQWKRFLEFYQPQKSARLQCYYLNALIRTGQAKAAYPKIEQLWLKGESQPKNCDRVFKAWQAAEKLTPDLVWKRMELALANHHRTLARYLVNLLPTNDQKLAKLWIKLDRKPILLERYQQQIIQSNLAMAPKILAHVAKRLASKEPQQASELWFKSDLHNYVELSDQYEMMQSLAISLSRKHLPGAETWFSIIPDQYLSNDGKEWRVRSALRHSQWQMALTAIDSLSPEQQKMDRWKYWRARALEELGYDITSLAHYTALAQRRSYYGFLAADRLGQPYVITDHPHQPTAGELFVLSQRREVQRARELFQLGRIVQARREWQQATTTMDNDQRSDASKLAQLWGWAEQSILTMASTDNLDDMDLRFPLLFQQEVLAHSERESIDPAWTYGVIRRESAFVQDARSSKGAVGLMQLMPATAKRMSRSLKKVEYHNSTQLTHADINLALGTRYLHKMLERFKGQTVLATAAYNAGEHRIDRWLPNKDELDAQRWIENIPLRETREYVMSVLAFTVIYADRLGLETQRLSERMPTIPARETLLSHSNI